MWLHRSAPAATFLASVDAACPEDRQADTRPSRASWPTIHLRKYAQHAGHETVLAIEKWASPSLSLARQLVLSVTDAPRKHDSSAYVEICR